MTRNIAPELAPRVRVNAIDVGGVATRSLDIVLTDDDLRATSSSPARRWAGRASPRTSRAPCSTWCPTRRRGSPGKVFEVDGGTESPAITVPVPPLEPVEGREGPYRV